MNKLSLNIMEAGDFVRMGTTDVLKYQPNSCETIIVLVFNEEDLLFMYGSSTFGKTEQNICGIITKTCLYNVDPLKPHFYIVKVGFTGVYIIFLISAQNIDCGYSLEPPRRGGSNEYPQSMILSRNKKNIRIFIWKFSIFWL